MGLLDWQIRMAIAWALWVPVSVVFFRVLEPRRAAILAVVEGHLFLPSDEFFVAIPPWLREGQTPLGELGLSKEGAIAAGLLAGVLLFDRQRLRAIRPRLLDLFAFAYVLFPMTGVVASGPVALRESIVLTLDRLLCWGTFYAAGRLYFGDEAGVLRLAVAAVISLLALAPFFLFESVMGPSWYLGRFLYGLDISPDDVARLGGYRPHVFTPRAGLLITNWLAFGAVLAFWLWLGSRWRPRHGPGWLPAAVLVSVTLASRGFYADAYLTIGLVAALLTLLARTPAFISALAGVAPAYIVLRASGTWTQEWMLKHPLIQSLGKFSSLRYRLRGEDEVMAVLRGGRMLLGTGVDFAHHALVAPQIHTMYADGLWYRAAFTGGYLGLAVYYLAQHLAPAFLALSRPRGRPSRHAAGSAAWGLALVSLLQMLDSLQNLMVVSPMVVVAGAIVGSAMPAPQAWRPVWGGATRGRSTRAGARFVRARAMARAVFPGGERIGAGELAWNAVRLAVVLGALALPELLARWTGGRPAGVGRAEDPADVSSPRDAGAAGVELRPRRP